VARGVTAASLLAAAVVAGVAMSPDAERTVQAVGELGSGGEYHAMTPARVFDSRESDRLAMSALPSTTFDVPIVGRGGLPDFIDGNGDSIDDNVLAVAISITVIQPDQTGYLQAYGKGTNAGTTSLVNFYAGEVVPNTAILRPGADGELTVRVVAPINPGTVDVAVDVFGWFSTSTHGEAGARIIPAGPGRLYDSRLPEFGGLPLGAGEQVAVPIRGASSFSPVIDGLVPNSDEVVGALVNITGVNSRFGSTATFLSAIPESLAPGTQPSTSNLNLLEGQVRSVMAVVPVGADGSIRLYNRAGRTDVIVDLVAYLADGQDPETRAGRIIPLVSPFRALDTRDEDFFNQPLAPANAEDWSFESFVNDVKIGDEAVGPQLGLLGNLTATGLQRQYEWAPVSSFLTAYPSPSDGSTAVPEISNITITEGQTMPNLVLLRFGSTPEGPNRVRVYNRAGYLDYLLDVSAVILSD